MGKTAKNDLQVFLEKIQLQLDSSISEIRVDTYEKAVEIITDAEKKGNRIHITGIGKPSHIAGYMASLLSSTGTKTYFLDGTEAVHGSCGQLEFGDVVICISNSGETEELKSTVTAIKNNGCKIIPLLEITTVGYLSMQIQPC